ncbi:unnamed protein product [Nippostrongylus brasiliensis]|uniref:G_PROTEIN_RECEP_F1_2 domain-containing protein n=1 Tax=Nippostrongylus brasiliensis TaxID=27835 RepID=A0A0N4YSQ3_NIPBR|nr:unnamed protein product [Nippostrongylus brasiliensis]
MTTQPREWTHDSAVYYFFDFHIMTITQTLVPFVILFALNIVIIRKLTATSDKKEIMCDSHAHINSLNSAHSPSANGDVGASTSPMLQATHVISLSIRPVKSVSASVRSAIMTMVAIVASYLISNTLHLILTVMERSDHPILKDPNDPLLSSTFHTFFSDAVSFVYMFTSAIRLLIYFVCNPVIRNDIRNFFRSSASAVPL